MCIKCSIKRITTTSIYASICRLKNSCNLLGVANSSGSSFDFHFTDEETEAQRDEEPESLRPSFEEEELGGKLWIVIPHLQIPKMLQTLRVAGLSSDP